MLQVKKRNDDIVAFDSNKIKTAVSKAVCASAVDGKTPDVDIDAVMALLKHNIYWTAETEERNVFGVEEIQNYVENALMELKYYNVARKYILYREQHRKARESVNAVELVSSYINRSDWRVFENSNAGFSFPSLLNHVSGSVIANYTLNEVYPEEICNAHVNGDFHLHDLSCGVVGYCAGWSLRDLLEKGFQGKGGRASAAPAKHFDTALCQIVNFLCTLQTEWAGAQAFSSFDTLLAPFVAKDTLSYNEIKQCMQRFVFGLNIASRWGQTPFTNLTFDWTCPDDLKDYPVIIGGEPSDEFTYGEFQPQMDLINKAFLEVMAEGDALGGVFTFPIPTYNITKDFNWDSENAKLLFEVTGKYGLPYFQNFINSELKPTDVRSMCCRLQMDLRQLRNKTGGLFGSGEQTGSIGVVTINLPRLGYTCKTFDAFKEKLKSLMILAKNSLEIKRKIVSKHLEEGLLPYTQIYLPSFDHHFSTIGLVGMNEAIMNFKSGENITTKYGQDFAYGILNFMRHILQEFQEETGHIYNLEATPAEGTSYRLARIDVGKYPDIITAGEETPYYTNSTQLPVGFTDDIFEAMDLQDSLQTCYTGGTVFHTFIGERISDPKAVAKLVKSIAYRYKMPYFTISPTFSICPVHGYIPGEHETCPYDD